MKVPLKIFQNKTDALRKSEDFIHRVQEEGIKAKANDEQVRNTITKGFFPHIQSSIMNHDIEAGALGMSMIPKWALVAESFQPTAPISVDTARLQRQIEELSTRLESTQLRVVTEPKKMVQFDEPNKEESLSRSREQSPEPYRASEPYRGRGTRPQSPEPYRSQIQTSGNQTTGSRRGTLNYGRGAQWQKAIVNDQIRRA